jgi:hypothetical protein
VSGGRREREKVEEERERETCKQSEWRKGKGRE